jgi:hypothetical protein
MIKEYMEIGVKNDDALIKLATIIQRIESAAAKGDANDFNFDDLQDLLLESENLEKEVKDVEKQEDEDAV